jgi:hypothetical protein
MGLMGLDGAAALVGEVAAFGVAAALSCKNRGGGDYGVDWVQMTGSQARIPAIDADIAADSLATTLQQALPGGGQVVVRWRDPQGGMAGSISDGAESHLSILAEQLLLEPASSEVAPHLADPCRVTLAWDVADGSRATIVAMPKADARRGAA